MHRMLLIFLTSLLLPLIPSSMAHGQETARVHPWLEPLVEEPAEKLPSLLRSELAGAQGRRTYDGKEALSLEITTTAKRAELEKLNIEVRTYVAGVATITVPLSELKALAFHPEIHSIMLPRPVEPTLDRAVPASGIDDLRTLAGGVASGATGAGVIIGVIDTGVDWDHPSFVRPDGSSRIVNLWDQTQDSSTTPMWFSYGTEWSNTDIDGGIVTEEDSRRAYGHGTHVTGIAAGNGRAPDASGMLHTFSGVAPEADIIVVKSDFYSDSIIDGIYYVFLRAQQLGRPAVVNLSLGGVIGAHDGTDPMEVVIDQLTAGDDGRAVVVSAGNSRADNSHARISAVDNATVSLTFGVDSYAPLALGPDNDQIIIVGYYDEDDDLTLELTTPTGNTYSRPLDSTFFGNGCTAPMWSGSGTVQLCNNDASNINQATASNELIIFVNDENEFNRPGPGTWTLSLIGDSVTSDGAVDFWLYSRLGYFTDRAYFSSNVEKNRTLRIPGTAEQAIVVGAYETKDCWIADDGTTQSYSQSDLGQLAFFSGTGPTRDGRSKPDLVAPGYGVVSSLAEEAQSLIAASSNSNILVDDHHLLLEGTSMAAAMVSGAVALLLEEDPSRDPDDLRALLKSLARRDAATEQYDEWVPVGGTFPTILQLANYAYGAGKLDLGRWNIVDRNESNDSVHEARRLLSGEVGLGRLERSSDVDYFELPDVVGPDSLDIGLTHLTADYRLDLERLLMNPSCGGPYSVIESTSDLAGTNSELISEPVSNANRRFFKVSSPTGVIDAANDYELKAVITRPETNNFHGNASTAQILPKLVEMNIDGRIIGSERDYYVMPVGPFTDINLHTNCSPLGGPRLEIYDAAGMLKASGDCDLTYPTGFIPFRAEAGFYLVVRDFAGPYVLNISVD